MLFIYLLEEHPVYAASVQAMFESSLIAGDQLFTSCLAVGEAMVGARAQSLNEADALKRTMVALPFDRVPFDDRCVETFSALRARRLRTADAIQLACASANGIDLFLTNDKRLHREVVPGINRITGLESLVL